MFKIFICALLLAGFALADDSDINNDLEALKQAGENLTKLISDFGDKVNTIVEDITKTDALETIAQPVSDIFKAYFDLALNRTAPGSQQKVEAIQKFLSALRPVLMKTDYGKELTRLYEKPCLIELNSTCILSKETVQVGLQAYADYVIFIEKVFRKI